MANKKDGGKKGGFALTPITLAQPVKATDGFTNLVENTPDKIEKKRAPGKPEKSGSDVITYKPDEPEREVVDVIKEKEEDSPPQNLIDSIAVQDDHLTKPDDNLTLNDEKSAGGFALTEDELLRILDADSLDEIYELSDVLRASSLKLYATLIGLADSRGRTRVKNHELMSKAGIKGIATLYKQERWLMDLKLLEKKAKPGPHDGSSYVVHKLKVLPLPEEIYHKFDDYLFGQKQPG